MSIGKPTVSRSLQAAIDDWRFDAPRGFSLIKRVLLQGDSARHYPYLTGARQAAHFQGSPTQPLEVPPRSGLASLWPQMCSRARVLDKYWYLQPDHPAFSISSRYVLFAYTTCSESGCAPPATDFPRD